MAGLNTRADIPVWDSITDGTTLYKGGYVTRAGRYWLCKVYRCISANGTAYSPTEYAAAWEEALPPNN